MANTLIGQVYGQGWAFPIKFIPDNKETADQTAGIVMAQGIEDVSQSLEILFLTEPGERIMREDFGCGLQDFVFENISDTLISAIKNRIQQAILRYEPRAYLLNVDIQTKENQPGHLLIQINWKLRGSDISQRLDGVLRLHSGQALELL
ncbi:MULTISPECIES: GPW/gp25 family protein [Photorhabdus]|uniref:IraD/Gp25-like domain-containing protein n=2 Tax=Photorhabdus asymbiotica TaxID=291112 RepID=A0ABX9SQP7_9GAMM|nr:GPW/gp25 family protein [Photorhabdus asymbiotica]RKS65781.1 hypothetical protein BDD30_0050 [Photorhabdus asymbiotica]CAQ84332.1 similar to base plate protein gp25 of bacteriophage [Photorhabdus asymbiotica]CAR66843.1 similar to base plate protein gp25 of bacteriophage [Photorhabdus asymbiotica subsp. asymbiotica ATCC 43949]